MTRTNAYPPDGTLDRRAVAACLLRDPGGLLVVTGLGSTTYDAGAAGDRPLNFYLWGAMGGAAMIGLGLAIAQDILDAYGWRMDFSRSPLGGLAVRLSDAGFYAKSEAR
jgi:hypothetical protein